MPPPAAVLLGQHRDAVDDEPEEAEEQREDGRQVPPRLLGLTGGALRRDAPDGALTVTATHEVLQSGETEAVTWDWGVSSEIELSQPPRALSVPGRTLGPSATPAQDEEGVEGEQAGA